jgi:hypothetical protein
MSAHIPDSAYAGRRGIPTHTGGARPAPAGQM